VRRLAAERSRPTSRPPQGAHVRISQQTYSLRRIPG